MIDTHCHLNDAEAFPEPSEAVEAALEAGVELQMVVGTTPDGWSSAVALAERFPSVYAIVGWHPNYTADYRSESLDALRMLIQHHKVVALGEIGLDYHWSYASKDEQFRALREQLDLARELSVPVVFHAREAYCDLLKELEGRPPMPYLFHCWMGNRDEARRATELGAYFGVDGPITYKNADELRSVVRQMPSDRLVLETDSPYLSPVPYRGKPNQSAYIPQINRALAVTLSMEEDECAKLTTQNARRFFRLDERA